MTAVLIKDKVNPLHPDRFFGKKGDKVEDCDCGKSWCHRHIVAKWLQKELKEEVKEFRFADPEPTKPKIVQGNLF